MDAYAWIEFFLGTRKGSKVKELIETVEDAYTPDTVLAELARKYFRERSPEKLVRERLTAIHGASQVLRISSELAVQGSKAYLDLFERAKKRKLQSPSLFDGLVLGAARLHDARVVTGDPHFEDLPETIWI
ncbi:MAG TPA: PIN domain-containing protein [Candidatus Bathyarchaeia archaeon]|nr:PIN domain-containing protein [Candidatus Bathyarchaeia archaeon]